MPWKVTKALKALLVNSKAFLEFGCGGSTILAGSMQVPEIMSIDSDINYLRATERSLKKIKTSSDSKFLFADIGKTGFLGRPILRRYSSTWNQYPMLPWINKFSPDLVLIDGRFRLACGYATLRFACAGTLIFFDDFQFRPCYWPVAEMLIKIKTVGRACLFKVPRIRCFATLDELIIYASHDFR